MDENKVLIDLSSALSPVQKVFAEALRTLETDHAVSSAIMAMPPIQAISDAVAPQSPIELTLKGTRDGQVQVLVSDLKDMEPTSVEEKYVFFGTFVETGKKFVAFLIAGLTAPGILFEAKT